MRRLARSLGLRPGEGRLLGLVAATFAAIEAGRGMGEVGVDALFLSSSGISALPPLYVGLGIAGLVLTLGYGIALGAFRGDRFFPGLLLSVAAALLGGRLALATGAPIVLSALWVTVVAAGGLLLTASWTIAGRVFDARQARRLFPLCASAGIAGSFVGQLSAGPIAVVVGAEQLVALEALALVVAAFVVSRIGAPLRGIVSPSALGGPSRSSPWTTLRDGATWVSRSPLLRLIAVAYVLFAVLLTGVWFSFQGAMKTAYPSQDALATALGLFSAGVTATAFLVSTLLANRLASRIGITAMALLLPVVYLLGFGLWLVQFSLATAVVVRFAQVVTQRGLSNAAWTGFFSVVPGARRAAVLAIIDGVPGQLGTIASGLVLMVAVAIRPRDLFLGGLVVAVACLLVVIAIRRAYITTLIATLREGVAVRVLERGPDLATVVADPRVVAGLIAAAGAADPMQRRIVAQVLGDSHAQVAVPTLERLAADADARVRASAIDSLANLCTGTNQAVAALDAADAGVRRAGVALLARHPEAVAEIAPEAVDRLAHDPDPTVRSELAVALAGAGDRTRARDIMGSLLDGPGDDARIAAIEAMVRRPDLVEEVGDRLITFLDDPSERVRTAAASALRRRPGGQSTLVSMVASGSPEASDAALGAIADGADLAPADRARLIAWSSLELDRASFLATQASSIRATLRDAVWPPATAALASTLALVLDARQRAARDRLLAALGAISPPGVAATIRRSLASGSAETRAQAVETLEVVGGGGLSRRVAALIDDGTPPARGHDLLATVAVVSSDPDRWVRAFALRTLWSARMRIVGPWQRGSHATPTR